MKRALPLVVLMALWAWSGCTVEGHGLEMPDVSAAGGSGGVSPAGGVAADGASGLGDGSGGALGNTGAPMTDGEAGSDDAQQSGGTSGSDADVASGGGGSSGSDAVVGADDALPNGGTSGSDAGAGADVAAGNGGTSGSDAGTGADDAAQSGGTSGSDAGAGADVAAGSGGSAGSDAGADADGAADSGSTSGRDVGLSANDSASSDRVPGNDAGFDSASKWRPVWSDEFNLGFNAGADTNKWNVATWEPNTVNGERQKYTARVENVFHDGQGHLVLRGLNIPWTSNGTTYKYTSGRLQTDGDKFQFSFGRVEVRAKLPAGQGSYPAILLMGTTGTWPESGEIGMMEQRGQDKSWLYCSTYSGTSSDINQKVTFPDATTLSSDFHVYALEWYSDHMVFFIDDVQVAQSNFDTTSPFYTGKFYIILDVAIGGTMGGTIDDVNGFPMDMVLDYVRVYTQ
jgi:beta-glucanase (GH16 family)